MNYTINADIYNIVDVNYKKKDVKGVLLASEYVKEPINKRSFSVSTEVKTAATTYTAAEIIAAVKTKLNLPETVVDVKLTANGKDLVLTEAVTDYGVRFEASFPCKTEPQVAPVQGPQGAQGPQGTPTNPA